MTDEAASRFEIGVQPHFPLDVVRALRKEVDALLGFLARESKTERPENDASIQNLQPSLFEAERPCVELHAAQKSELATLIKVLLREIAVALAKSASGGSGDDQDYD
jgi:hypothetical protein